MKARSISPLNSSGRTKGKIPPPPKYNPPFHENNSFSQTQNRTWENPPLSSPSKPKPDAFEPPVWEFPSIVYEPFNLEPKFLQLQHKFKLSKLVNSM